MKKKEKVAYIVRKVMKGFKKSDLPQVFALKYKKKGGKFIVAYQCFFIPKDESLIYMFERDGYLKNRKVVIIR